MRLVGATRWYTQLPFLFEAVVARWSARCWRWRGCSRREELFIDDVLADVYDANIVARISTATCCWCRRSWCWSVSVWPRSPRTSRCACTCANNRFAPATILEGRTGHCAD